jgi:hypothetical protein
MDLRDHFAVHIAAALVDAFRDPEHIARHAYDLADAMIAERARRIDAAEGRAIAMEPELDAQSAPPFEHHTALLDRPEPILESDEELDPSWLEPPYDPTWDADLRREETPHRSDAAPAVGEHQTRPGLSRTQPEVIEVPKERSA